MKVLVLSVTAGYGHNIAAQAVAEQFEKMGIECSIVDTLKYTSPVAATALDKGYLAIGKAVPKANDTIYKTAMKSLKEENRSDQAKVYGRLFGSKLKELVNEYKPDAIICTHFIASLILTYLKRKGKLDPSIYLVGINTDYAMHPFWEDTEMDHIVIADKKMKYKLLNRGFDWDKILPIGIPISEKFSTHNDKQEMKEKLGFNELPLVIVMGGSMGFGKVIKRLLRLDMCPVDFQIATICGNNETLEKRVRNISTKKKVHVYGFVNNVDEFMDAADCIITKPGGLTSSECLAKNIPMIISDCIPGVEYVNRAFLVNQGAAAYTSEHFQLDEAVYDLLMDEDFKENMKHIQRTIAKPNSAKELCETVEREVLNKRIEKNNV